MSKSKNNFLRFAGITGFAVLLFLASGAIGGVVHSATTGLTFLADYETGNLSQWPTNCPAVGGVGSGTTLVTSPVREGTYAAKYVVNSGDRDACAWGGERGELATNKLSQGEGSEYYYAWSTYFPADWRNVASWGVFTQWHAKYPSQPNMAIVSMNPVSGLQLDICAGVQPTGSTECTAAGRSWTPIFTTIPKGQWIDFIMHVKWSSTNTGLVEVWTRLEGQTAFTKVISKLNIPTLQSQNGEAGYVTYMQQGLYRGPTGYAQTIYHDGMRVGPTYDSVLYPVNGAAQTTYLITSSAGAGGSITPSATVLSGANQTFTITPNAGYSIASVTVDGVNQGALNSYTFSNVTATHTIAATFTATAPSSYAITVTQGANGTISPVSTSVAPGGTQTFTITPNTGYAISSVTVDGVNQGAISSYTFSNVTAAHTITASFSFIVSGTVSSIGWQGWAFANQTGTFTAEFDATPLASSMDGVTGLSSTLAIAYTQFAAAVRFNSTNTIDARNGATYAAASSIPYTPNTNYHFRLVVNMATHTYSAYVTPQGGTEITIGTNYAFRVEQAAVTNLSYWNINSAIGTFAVRNFAITSSVTPDTTAPSVSLSSPLAGSTVSGTVAVSATASDNIGVAGVQFKLDGVNFGAEITAAPYSVTWDTTSATNATHTLTAVARDSAGNTTTSSAVTVTVSNMVASTKFILNDRVQVTSGPLNVRATANTAGTLLGTQATNALGTVIGGPIVQGGYQWWNINYDTGVDGWSAEDFLAKYVAPATYVISVTQGANGTISPASASVLSGGSQIFTITPAVGYVISSVTIDGMNQGAINSYTFSNVTAAHSISATFALTPPTTYNITVTQGANGTIIPGTATVTSGGSQTFTIAPNAGYAIASVTVDGVNKGAVNSYTFSNVTGTHTITAAFVSTADVTPPVVLLTSPIANAVVSGTISLSASATDNVGVAGVQFKIDGGNLGVEDTIAPYTASWDTTNDTNASHVITVVARDTAGNIATSASVTVTVNNVLPTFNINVTQNQNGLISPNTTAVAQGADQTFTITPNAGYAISSVFVDGVNQGAVNTYTFTNVTAIHTLTANFVPTTDTIAPSVPAGLSGVAVSTTAVNLSWAASTDNIGITGYYIYRNGAQIGTSNSTSYSDTALTAGTAYSYTVSAYDAAGNMSAQSAAISVTTLTTQTSGTLIVGSIVDTSYKLGYSSSYRSLTQSFLAPAATITEIQVGLVRVKNPSNTITLSLKNGVNGTVLYSTTIDHSQVLTTSIYSPTWITVKIPSTVVLTKGTTYYVTLTTSSTSSSNYYRWPVSSGTHYTGGTLYLLTRAQTGMDGLMKVTY